MKKGILIAILGIGVIYLLTKKAGAESVANIPQIAPTTTPVLPSPSPDPLDEKTTQASANLLPIVSTTAISPVTPPAEYLPEPVYTPSVSLLYVVNPADIIANKLPLMDPPSVVPFTYFTNSVYTLYPDVLKLPQSVLTPETLYVPGGNSQISSNLQYFNDLRTRQAEIATTRQELEKARLEAGMSKTTNRPIHVLKLVLDHSEYEKLSVDASKVYVPIDSVNIPVGSSVLGDDLILPSGPSTYSEVYAMPAEPSQQKSYRVFGQLRSYPLGSQIALVRLADNNTLEFDLTLVYLEYQRVGKLELYLKAVSKFLDIISKLRIGELSVYTQAPAWDTRPWAGRTLQFPPLIMVLYVIGRVTDSKPFDPRY